MLSLGVREDTRIGSHLFFFEPRKLRSRTRKVSDSSGSSDESFPIGIFETSGLLGKLGPQENSQHRCLRFENLLRGALLRSRLTPASNRTATFRRKKKETVSGSRTAWATHCISEFYLGGQNEDRLVFPCHGKQDELD